MSQQASTTGSGGAPPKACIVRADWDPPVAQDPHAPQPTMPVSVKRDSLAWAYRKLNGWAYIELASPPGVGWLPLSIIQVGVDRVDRDKIPMVIPDTDVRNISLPPPSTRSNCLMRTLEDLWKTIAASKNELLQPISHTDTKQIERDIFGPHSKLFAAAFYDCLHPQARDIMNNGQFNLRQLVQRLPKLNSKNHNGTPGCYLWVYEDIKDNKLKFILHDPTITDAAYIGQSDDMYARWGRHERFLKGQIPSRSNHYRVGKGARTRTMIPLLFINRKNDYVKGIINAIGLARFLDVMELTLVCLFQSWYPILVHDDPAHPLKRELAAGSLREIQYAKILNGIMAKVRARTTWAPRGTIGLNWLTPVFSQFNSDRTIMYWYSDEHKAYIFRTRRPMMASKTQKGGPMVNITDKLRLSVPVEVFRDGELSHGQEIHIQFKIGYDQKTQRFTEAVAPYVRLLPVTANNEFLKLRSLSIQIQWVDPKTGNWKAAVIQRAKMLEMDKQYGELAAVTWGMRLWILLTRTSYAEMAVRIPAWIPDVTGVGRFDVKEVFYDHLRQEYRVRPAQTQTVTWPAHLSDNEKLFMQQCFVKELSKKNFVPKIAIGKKPWDLPKTRANCDCCLSTNDTAPCKPIGDGSICETCKKLGLARCTWTYAHLSPMSAADFFKTGGLLSDLGVPTFVSRYADQRIEVLPEAPYDAEAEVSAAQEASEHN